MPINLTGINWLTTYNCNAQCEHCFFDVKGPKKYMTPELIDLVYKDFRIPKQMFWNHISGGEVFLDKDSFLEIVKRTRSYFSGSIGISTNGFWAKNEHTAKKIVQECIDAGISGIAVSTDHFHKDFIPVEFVKYASSAIEQSGLKNHCYIMGARTGNTDSSKSINECTELLAAEVRGEKQIPLAPTTIRSIGKGSKINTPKNKGIPQGKCTELSTCLGARDPFNPAMVWIDAHGNVMICYGIIIGNVYKTSFNEIISNYSPNSNPITAILKDVGPKGLHNLSVDFGLNPPLNYFDECDVCFQNRKLLQKLFYTVLGPSECYPT